MEWKGFTVEDDGIYIHLDNMALRFDSIAEMEFIAAKIIKSANELKEDC
ncbi:hypothetical protein [Bacillus sp. AG4(2022)]|nr:hypothetical protein [Bacillus sp. AG4(2022)]MDT0160418.1 hypothetical protein [Bacillus sp. AG4(2022)]